MNLTPPQIAAVNKIFEHGFARSTFLHKETVAALIRKGVCKIDAEYPSWAMGEKLVLADNPPPLVEQLRIQYLLKSD
jgi:hypothetical protein